MPSWARLNDGSGGITLAEGAFSRAPFELRENASAAALAGLLSGSSQGLVYRRTGALSDFAQTASARLPFRIISDANAEDAGSEIFYLNESGDLFWTHRAGNFGRLRRFINADSDAVMRMDSLDGDAEGAALIGLDLSRLPWMQIPVSSAISLGTNARGSFAFITSRLSLRLKHNTTVNQFIEFFRIVAGTPDIPANMQDGGVAVDTTNNLLYFLSGGSWRRAAENGITGEVPGGVINGSNRAFTLTRRPASINSLWVLENGLMELPTTDYTLDASPAASFTFVAGNAPATGSTLYAIFV